MEVVNGCCAGLDVHQATVVVCARWTEQGQRRQEVATFGTMTRDLLKLSDWLRLRWDHLQQLERLQAQLEQQIEVRRRPFQREVERRSSIPGIKAQVAAALVAEIGVDLSVFPTDAHLASWAGVCPGNHESAGKHQSGRTTKSNRWLRRCLSQAAWAASHTRNTYFSAPYRRLAGRRGKKRAIIAVAHSLLVVAYHVLRRGERYQELGADHFQRRRPDSLRRSLIHQLEHL